MQVIVDDTDIKMLAEAIGNSANVTRKQAVTVLNSVSLALEKRVKVDMPVDTGRARASWGHYTPADIITPTLDGDGGAVWEVDEDGLSVLQGSNVPYIEWLNAGHSRQAPPGFIDRGVIMAELVLDENLGNIDPLSPEYAQRLYLGTFG